MNITIKPEQEQFIQSQIERGIFANAEQAIPRFFAQMLRPSMPCPYKHDVRNVYEDTEREIK